MSLGNDPSRVPDRQEPEPEPCRYCPGKTHDPQRVCPDCRHERGNRLVPDGGEEVGRGGPQKPSDHIYTGEDETLRQYLRRESINWTYHHRYSEETVDEPYVEMLAYCFATFHDGVAITPLGYETDEVKA